MKFTRWQRLEEFEVESAEPNGVVSGRDVEEYNACLIARLKHVLDVVGEEGDLIYIVFSVHQSPHACVSLTNRWAVHIGRSSYYFGSHDESTILTQNPGFCWFGILSVLV